MEDIGKAFDKAVGKKTEAEKEQDKKALEALEVFQYIYNVLSIGVIKVRIMKPCRKKKDGTYHDIGFVVSVSSNFHLRKTKVTVAYPEGFEKKFGKEKKMVPYTDVFFAYDLQPIELVQIKPKEQENE